MRLSNVREKVWNCVTWFFVLIEILAFVMLGIRFQSMKVLPVKYMLLYVIVVILLSGLSIVLKWKRVTSIRRGIVLILLSSLCFAVSLYGIHALGKVKNTIDEVTEDAKEVTSEMVVLVLKDSGNFTITQMDQILIGYMSSDADEIAEIKEEMKAVLQAEPGYVDFPDVFSLVDALYARIMNAIVIDKAFYDILTDTEGYENFLEDTEEIYATEFVNYIDVVEQDTNLNQFVVYISGIDRFGAVSAKSRSDVNLLLAVNTETKQIQIINTPRDYYVPLANSGGVRDKLTHAGIYGVDNSIGTLEMLYGVKIDYYVRMNFSGFEAIIDALGGIDVYSEYDFTVDPIKHYEKGINHVNGIEALAFARERHAFAAGDIQRGKNQMEVVRATIQKAISPEILYQYSKLLDSISEMLQTNMSSQQIYSLVRMQLSDMASWDIQTYSVTGTGSKSTTYSMPNQMAYVMIPNDSQVDEAKRMIANVLEGVKE